MEPAEVLAITVKILTVSDFICSCGVEFISYEANRGQVLIGPVVSTGQIPSIEEFKALFPLIIVTDNVTKQKKLVKYVLVGIERQGTSAAVLDYEQMTIEHLAPQSLIGQPGYDDVVIGQIGNLLLVSEEVNGMLKDKSFTDKKRILAENGYKLPESIEQAATWGPVEIKQRTEGIADEAYNTVWKP